MHPEKRASHGIVSTIALFGSFSTLFCCALPALLVSIGAGAAVIGLVSTFPQLIWLSEHKVGLFIFAGIMLTLSGTMRYLTRNAPCPADPAKAKACMRMRRFSLGIFLFSLAMYSVGFYFAFIAAKLM
ncbi:hypothetical protein GC177_00910 [bacterium]|nr:hypothetical protein [bacterium]